MKQKMGRKYIEDILSVLNSWDTNKINLTSIGVKAPISDYIIVRPWDMITHPCPNWNIDYIISYRKFWISATCTHDPKPQLL